MSDRGHANPPESLATSSLHFNAAAVVVASCAAPALLSTGDQQMLIRENKQWEGGVDIFEAVGRQVRGRNGAKH